MPGRFIYWMNTSLDLMIEKDAHEGGDGAWMRITDSLHEEFNERARRMALDVTGRVTYELMESYWPLVPGDAEAPPVMRDYAEIWMSKPKVLVSRTRRSSGYGTRVIGNDGRDAIAQLVTLKEEVDGDIVIGGPTLATQALRVGLLDELVIYTHPVILGRGRPLFDLPFDQIELDVVPHEVVNAVRGCEAAEPGVGSMVIVMVEPVGVGGCASSV